MPAGRPKTKRDFDGNPPNPGSQSALRQRNQQRIIGVLVGGPQTQAELARQTGLSTATVSNIVKAMVDAGLATTAPTTSSGRRALSVILNDNGSLAVGIDIGRRHVRVVLAGLNYQVMQDEAVTLPLGHCAEEGLDAAESLLDLLLLRAGTGRSSVLGAGVGIPGPHRGQRIPHGEVELLGETHRAPSGPCC